MSRIDSVESALKHIFDGIDMLRRLHIGRRFTIDGRLVGDIGEMIAEQEFEISLDSTSRAQHDAKTQDGRDVQIKATFQNSLTFRTEPELFLGLKLFSNGSHEVIFNGPGSIITNNYSHRRGFGVSLLSFPIAKLRGLSEKIPESQKIPRRITAIFDALP